MMVNEIMEKLNNTLVSTEKSELLSKMYGTTLPDIIYKILSCKLEDNFISENIRLLYSSEMLDADKAFVDKGLVPVADCMDNDYVVYRIRDQKWCLYNLFDECEFSIHDDLEELITEYI
jgi:hypothetical protein